MAVPNQKTVIINKAPTDRSHIYTCINIDALQKAMCALTPAQLKVWMYFAKNQNNYEFDLSSVAVCEFCNISDKTYRDAVKALIAQRYLIKRQDGVYDFYEIPVEEKIEVPKDGVKIVCHTSTMLVTE